MGNGWFSGYIMVTNIAACQKQQLYEGSIKILNPQITISREHNGYLVGYLSMLGFVPNMVDITPQNWC